MRAFTWGKQFVTGIDRVDGQHQQLVNLINDLGDHLAEPVRMSGSAVEHTFQELVNYAQYHFQEEEKLMLHRQIDRRHLDMHRQEHEGFLEDVTAMQSTASPDDVDSVSSLLKFLIHWLAYHILGSDQIMVKQLRLIEQGKPANIAFSRVTEHEEGATGPLLAALNGLFLQVRERNSQLMELNRTLDQKVNERTRELFRANQRLERIATTDQLTGLPNRRHALQQFKLVWEESSKSSTPLACAMIDADGFKQINDRYGHDAGDVVLKELSGRLIQYFRTDDFVARLGGDEFLVILPNTPLSGAMKIAEKVRNLVADMAVPAGTGIWLGSISVGVAERLPGMTGYENLIKSADRAVYTAKANGRNRVEHLPGLAI
ncbi:MAG: bacteriohemerythrin [Gammaproteobacteria bacterium]|nr:bacteriohemerythrin [Gammaproteobacteria bacterium]